MSGVPDVVRPGLAVLFCGINPGTRSGELGQHFARPGNRFWKVLHQSGFTDRVLRPDEQWLLLDYGLGITNLVARTSAAASDLAPAELRQGAAQLETKVAELAPQWIAILGVLAYRVAFGRPGASIGRQTETIGWRSGGGSRSGGPASGGPASGLWVLPNPSGLQAHYQLPDMVKLYSELRHSL